MRKIEDLLTFKLNFDIHHELECQILFDNRKAKVEEESLMDEYDDEVDTVSWESIEMSSWDLMKTKGMNWKVFVIWIESLIYIHGWDEVIYCFTALNLILRSKLDILLKEEERVGCIEFFDKSISRALVLQPVKDEYGLFQFLTYKKTNPQKLYDVLGTMTIENYQEFIGIYKTCIDLLSAFPMITKEVHLHFSKILDMFSQLYDILNFYAKNFIEEEEDADMEDDDSVAILDNKIDSSIEEKNKILAFAKIAEALELLKESDPQNIAIPLLRKIMRWHNKNISEIFHEFNDKDGAFFILKFLMD